MIVEKLNFYAPIVLFVYSRLHHTQKTVEALSNNSLAKDSDLIIYSDSSSGPDFHGRVEEVRAYLKCITGFRSVVIRYRPYNFGLSKSIVDGVTEVLKHHNSLIVLEDDLVTSPYFLSYMNEALEKYRDNDHVISIHGYIYPVKGVLPEAFFLRGADCWGWATWRRGWALFNPDGQHLYNELKQQDLINQFDFNNTYPFSKMLQEQIKGSNDSWAVRWYASAFLENKLTLYPGKSLVRNIGNDGGGTHCDSTMAWDVELSLSPISLNSLVVDESIVAKRVIKDFFRPKRSITKGILLHLNHKKLRQRIISLAKDWIPQRLLRKLRCTLLAMRGFVAFEGPFSSWEATTQISTGYDGEQILEKVLSATLKVKHGKAAFERDSVLFEEIQYAWPVTAGLMLAAARNDGRLSVLDFGGALGSGYFQNSEFIKGLKNVRWSVVEQPHFVEAGREHIQDESLVFYPTIMECIASEKPNVVLLSSVLQYLEKPGEILEELMGCGADLIIIDRTPFHSGVNDLIVKQVVPEAIYSASYPMWILSRSKFINTLSQKFKLSINQLSPEGHISFGAHTFSFECFIFRSRSI